MKKPLPLLLAFLAYILVTQGCTKAGNDDVPGGKKDTIVVKPPPVTDTVPKASYDLSLLEKCTVFATTPVITNLQRQDNMELSGLASSRSYPGLVYMHEDSGNGNEVFISNAKGDDLGKIVLDDVSNRDWEDIACGPGPDNSKNYLYVADIGDNDSAYPGITIYRFPEPDLSGASPQTVKHLVPEKLRFIYPRGAVNAESLLLDPITKDLLIVTKEVGRSTLFVARYPQSATAVTTLSPLAYLSFDLLTAGDISRDGTEIILRNTGQIWYWKRSENESIAKTLLRKPQDAPYTRNEHQGEAVCFLADGSGYFTLSETKKFPGDQCALSFYQRK